LVLAHLAVSLLPAARLVAYAERSPRRQLTSTSLARLKRIAGSVEDVGTSRLLKASCLVRALAATAMLRRRGVPTRLCLGVARNEGQLAAHAWIEVGPHVLTGAAQCPAFTRLAEFG
jgi:hypothetical protein